MPEIVHYASVKDGAIIQFPFSAYYFMKVCSRDGIGAIVNLFTGELLNKNHLMQDNLGLYCKVVADNIESFLQEDEEKDTFYQMEDGDDADDEEEWCDENCAKCEYKTLCSESPFHRSGKDNKT